MEMQQNIKDEYPGANLESKWLACRPHDHESLDLLLLHVKKKKQKQDEYVFKNHECDLWATWSPHGCTVHPLLSEMKGEGVNTASLFQKRTHLHFKLHQNPHLNIKPTQGRSRFDPAANYSMISA